jgi:hypothetical protein
VIKEGGGMVKVEKVEQTAFLRNYMKCKIAMVRNISKICSFAIKTIEICKYAQKLKKSLKYALICKIKAYHCNQNHSNKTYRNPHYHEN